MAWKPRLKTIHTSIGIVSGVFLSVITLTGSVILFRAEFERAAFPQGAASDGSRRASLDDVAREIAAMRPDGRIRRVRIPSASAAPYIVQIQSSGKRTERIVSDSATARILGTIQSGWLDWMVDLHRNLLAGPTGRNVVGAFGIILFTLSATGSLLWFTRARNWRAWISVRRGGSTVRFHYELHRVTGLWTYAFMALISFTGVEIAYPNVFRNAVQSLTGQPATIHAPQGGNEMRLFLDEYVRIGHRAMPDGVPVELRLPEGANGPVDLRLYRAGDLAPEGNHVYMDPATGAVWMVDRIVDRPLGARFLAAMSPVHYAEFGGITVKIAWALFGFAPVLLLITGLFIWWRPAKSKSVRVALHLQQGALVGHCQLEQTRNVVTEQSVVARLISARGYRSPDRKGA